MQNNYIIRDGTFNKNAYVQRSNYKQLRVSNVFKTKDGHSTTALVVQAAPKSTAPTTTTTTTTSSCSLQKNFDGSRSSLPQIAIKRKDNDSLCTNNTEVVLLNGNWDTSNEIPNIIAEMHIVNAEELQNLHNICKSNKEIKLELNGCATTPSPLGSDSGIEGDCSDGNLSWLLNYKIHELPPVPDYPATDFNNFNNLCNNVQHPVPPDGKSGHGYVRDNSKQYCFQQQVQNVNIGRQEKQVSCKFDVLKAHKQTYRYAGPKKPPFTYTELIEHALNEKGELTVSGIYQWISDHFPFYKQNDDRWKNSVRHNLSINPHFRKGSKAVHGAGHLWTVAQKEDMKAWNIKKQRMQQFIQTTLADWNSERQQELELATATASIMTDDTEDVDMLNGMYTECLNQNVRKQNVEVEYVIDVTDDLGDFLCPPVPKEQMAEECGLGGDYLITDLNPNTLGLNLSEAEIMSSANLYDDLNFHCYELQTE